MSVPQLDFRPYVEISGVYDTGLAGVSVNSQGELGNAVGEGVLISGGVSGLHSWRRTKIGLNYSASFAHYTQQTYYDYVNQNLLLSVTQQLARHIILSLTESGGLFSQNFNQQGLPQTVPFDPSTVQTPTTDFFDNRTYLCQQPGQADLPKERAAVIRVGGVGISGTVSVVRPVWLERRFGERGCAIPPYPHKHRGGSLQLCSLRLHRDLSARWIYIR